MKLLVVEDEVSIRNALYTKLTKAGFDVLTAENGKDGLNIALREKPDLIILDILMPIMDGMTMKNRLRDSGEYGQNVQVFLLSNYQATESEKMLNPNKTNGHTHYFLKSNVTLEDLVARIKEKLAP